MHLSKTSAPEMPLVKAPFGVGTVPSLTWPRINKRTKYLTGVRQNHHATSFPFSTTQTALI